MTSKALQAQAAAFAARVGQLSLRYTGNARQHLQALQQQAARLAALEAEIQDTQQALSTALNRAELQAKEDGW